MGAPSPQMLAVWRAAHAEVARGASIDRAVETAMLLIKAVDDDGETWAEDAERFNMIERLTRNGLLRSWRELRDFVLRTLGLDLGGQEPFNFDPSDLPALLAAAEMMAQRAAAPAGPLVTGASTAYAAGWRNALAQMQMETGGDAVQAAIDAQLARMREVYAQRGLQLVRSGVARRFREPIVAALSGGEFDGMNPVNVARELRRRFGHGEYNWERLARSEIAIAQTEAKLDAMKESGIEQVEYTTAGDSRVSAICRGLAAGNPYPIATAPQPVLSSHPNCRCVLVPVLLR